MERATKYGFDPAISYVTVWRWNIASQFDSPQVVMRVVRIAGERDSCCPKIAIDELDEPFSLACRVAYAAQVYRIRQAGNRVAEPLVVPQWVKPLPMPRRTPYVDPLVTQHAESISENC